MIVVRSIQWSSNNCTVTQQSCNQEQGVEGENQWEKKKKKKRNSYTITYYIIHIENKFIRASYDPQKEKQRHNEKISLSLACPPN